MPIADRVVVVGWDGLRPDLIDPALTPNVVRLIEQGCRFTRPTAVFPSETRPNSATIGTGVQPGRHGITANHILVPELGRVDTSQPDRLVKMAARFGRVLRTRTLGEVMAEGGKSFATMGSGSPGQTVLQNPHGVGWTINRSIRIPASIDDAVVPRFGEWPARPRGKDYSAIDDHLLRVALEHVLPELKPDALVLWSCEPDVALHAYGMGSREVRAVLRANDARLAQLLAQIDPGRTTLIFMSDHGHSTVSDRIDFSLAMPLPADQYQIVGDGFELAPSALGELPRVARTIAAQSWCGPLFVRDDVWDSSLADVSAPTSVLWDGDPGAWASHIQFSMAWDDRPNRHGFRGHVYGARSSAPPVVTDHGNLSPRDMGNTLIIAGAGVRRGTADLPAGNVDIAPTILHLLGLDVPDWMQGRPLTEALEGGAEPGPASTELLLEGRWGTLIRQRVGRSAYLGVA